jgi:hypothetical protein
MDKALCHKSDGQGFESRDVTDVLNPSDCTGPWSLLSF